MAALVSRYLLAAALSLALAAPALAQSVSYGPPSRTALHLPVSPLNTGAACDVVTGIDGSMTSGSAVLTSAGSTFPASAIGKRVVVTGAGAAPFSALKNGSAIGAAGSGYAANDTITMAGGTFSQAVIIQVITVDGGGAVLTWHVKNAGVYTVTAATLTQGSTTGGGTGFTLTPKFVGAPIYGTITAAAGGGTATLSATASNTIAAARWYYGTDDATGLQAAFDATKTTGSVPGQVIIPAAGCGTTVQLELPVVGAGNSIIGAGEVVGTNKTQSTIYAFAPMTAVLHRSSSFGWYGGARNLHINGNYLADYLLYVEGSTAGEYAYLFGENAKSKAFLFGNGVNSVTQIDGYRLDYRTDPNAFSSAQMPTRGIELATGSTTDSSLYFPTITGASADGILMGSAGDHLFAPHVYGSPDLGYCPTYGIRFASRSTASGGHIDCAQTAGILLDTGSGNVSVSDVLMNLFTGLPNAIGVEIASGVCNSSVSGITATSTSMRGAKQIVQDGTACVSTTVQNNAGATYSAYGSAGSGLQVSQFLPSDPTGTASSTQVMMGVGSTVAFTPTQSARIKITVSGQVSNDTGTANGATVQIRTGTGTAPANGDAATGTARGVPQSTNVYAAGAAVPFSTQAWVTGLTAGTAYWIDLGLARTTAGTASVKKLNFIVEEY